MCKRSCTCDVTKTSVICQFSKSKILAWLQGLENITKKLFIHTSPSLRSFCFISQTSEPHQNFTLSQQACVVTYFLIHGIDVCFEALAVQTVMHIKSRDPSARGAIALNGDTCYSHDIIKAELKKFVVFVQKWSPDPRIVVQPSAPRFMPRSKIRGCGYIEETFLNPESVFAY